MLANRVAMGAGLPKERFLWVAYADALMYPFPTGQISANSDRDAFFALEAKLLATVLQAIRSERAARDAR